MVDVFAVPPVASIEQIEAEITRAREERYRAEDAQWRETRAHLRAMRERHGITLPGAP